MSSNATILSARILLQKSGCGNKDVLLYYYIYYFVDQAG